MTDESAPDLPPETTRADALARLRRAFKRAGLDTAALDARILVTEALGLDPISLVTCPDAPIGREGAHRLSDFAARRLAREPVDRILGHREFWGLPFRLSPDTLSPRPETETLIEAALRHRRDQAPRRILDLGTGSGCILVALLHEWPASWGVGVDRSRGALGTARDNARRNGVGSRAGFVVGDWAASLRGPFDLIVSNPPYIRSGDLADLAPEVRAHDPAAALDGGPDGIAPYRAILRDAPRLLSPGGLLMVEIGWDQEPDLRRLAEGLDWAILEVARDLAGHPRVLVLSPSG